METEQVVVHRQIFVMKDCERLKGDRCDNAIL